MEKQIKQQEKKNKSLRISIAKLKIFNALLAKESHDLNEVKEQIQNSLKQK